MRTPYHCLAAKMPQDCPCTGVKCDCAKTCDVLNLPADPASLHSKRDIPYWWYCSSRNIYNIYTLLLQHRRSQAMPIRLTWSRAVLSISSVGRCRKSRIRKHESRFRKHAWQCCHACIAIPQWGAESPGSGQQARCGEIAAIMTCWHCRQL